jgi:hypothetical protein
MQVVVIGVVVAFWLTFKNNSEVSYLSAAQETWSSLWNLRVHYLVHKSPLMLLVPSLMEQSSLWNLRVHYLVHKSPLMLLVPSLMEQSSLWNLRVH